MAKSHLLAFSFSFSFPSSHFPTPPYSLSITNPNSPISLSPFSDSLSRIKLLAGEDNPSIMKRSAATGNSGEGSAVRIFSGGSIMLMVAVAAAMLILPLVLPPLPPPPTFLLFVPLMLLALLLMLAFSTDSLPPV